MTDPVTWQSVAQTALPGAIGGVIGAGSALWGSRSANKQALQAAQAEANRVRANRREDSLLAATMVMHKSHTDTLVWAKKVKEARSSTSTVLDQALEEYGASHLTAVRAQEGLRLLSRSVEVRAAIEALRDENGKIHDYANANPGKGYSISDASGKVRTLLRDLSDAVQRECDGVWEQANRGGAVR